MQTLAEILVHNYNNHLGIIDNEQLDDDLFKLWCTATIGIYKKVQIIKKDDNWSSSSDIKNLPENTEIYSLVSEIFSLIGPVNDFLLRRENNLGELFVAFSSAPRNEEEKKLLPNNNKRTLFRLRLERYLARLIIEQSLKTKRILEEELEALRIIRRLREHRRKKALLGHENNSSRPTLDDIERVNKLTFTSVLVRCNTYEFHAHNSAQKLTATVDIAMSSGKIIQEKTYLCYCPECKVYFILEYDYKQLCSFGVLLCQVISHENYKKGSDFSDLKPESLLHQSGYNVNSAKNLSGAQRQEILRRVIVNKLYSPAELVSFLDWLIKRNGNTSGKNMELAIKKWEIDKTYVIQHHMTEYSGV